MARASGASWKPMCLPGSFCFRGRTQGSFMLSRAKPLQISPQPWDFRFLSSGSRSLMPFCFRS